VLRRKSPKLPLAGAAKDRRVEPLRILSCGLVVIVGGQNLTTDVVRTNVAELELPFPRFPLDLRSQPSPTNR